MKTEYEVKFLAIDIDEIRARLTAEGAELVQPMRLMKRVTIDSPAMKQNDAFVRIRDEGDKTTLTYKQFDQLSIDGAKEFEVTVSDFNETVQLLAAAGLPHRSYQETRRETWELDHVELMIDGWPWLEPYIEIEAGSEEEVRAMAERLGFDWSKAVFGDVMAAYRAQYPHLTTKQTVGDVAEMTFDGPMPEMFEDNKNGAI